MERGIEAEADGEKREKCWERNVEWEVHSNAHHWITTLCFLNLIYFWWQVTIFVSDTALKYLFQAGFTLTRCIMVACWFWWRSLLSELDSRQSCQTLCTTHNSKLLVQHHESPTTKYVWTTCRLDLHHMNHTVTNKVTVDCELQWRYFSGMSVWCVSEFTMQQAACVHGQRQNELGIQTTGFHKPSQQYNQPETYIMMHIQSLTQPLLCPTLWRFGQAHCGGGTLYWPAEMRQMYCGCYWCGKL